MPRTQIICVGGDFPQKDYTFPRSVQSFAARTEASERRVNSVLERTEMSETQKKCGSDSRQVPKSRDFTRPFHCRPAAIWLA